MRDPLHASARRWGLTDKRPPRGRLVAGLLLFVSLIAAVSTGGANAGLLDMLFPTTTRLPATTTSTTTSTTSAPDTTPPEVNGDLTLIDTGLTRVRATVDNDGAEWLWFRLDGTEIKAVRVVSTSGSTKVTGTGPVIGVKYGPGQAVLEFVLKIAPAAKPMLTFCKNHRAPATITFTRLTDQPDDVAVVANNGSNPRPPANQCENLLRREISRTDLIGPVRWPARRDPRPLVLAHYFPWYSAQTVQQNIFGVDQPAYPADTDDPATVADAVDLAAGHGIDGFVVEYEGSPANDARTELVVAAADAKPGFLLAHTIDAEILARREGGVLTADTLDAALLAVTKWVSHPSQLFTDGKPVVFLYGASKVTQSDWDAALDRLEAITGIEPYVVANGETPAAPARYQMGTWGLMDRAALDAYAADKLYKLRIQPGLVGSSGPLWAAPVSPGYDDRRTNREREMYIDRANGQRYEDEWAAALSSLPDWIIVTTWNEYFEQTHVAPGATTGERALDQTARWAAQFHRTG